MNEDVVESVRASLKAEANTVRRQILLKKLWRLEHGNAAVSPTSVPTGRSGTRGKSGGRKSAPLAGSAS